MDNIKAEQVQSVTAGFGLQAHSCHRARSLPDDPLLSRFADVCVNFPQDLTMPLGAPCTGALWKPLDSAWEFLKASSPKLAAYSILPAFDLTAQLCPESSREFPGRRDLNDNSSSHLHVTKLRPGKPKSWPKAWLGQNADLLPQRRFCCTPVLPAGSDTGVSTEVELAFQEVKVGCLRRPEWQRGLWVSLERHCTNVLECFLSQTDSCPCLTLPIDFLWKWSTLTLSDIVTLLWVGHGDFCLPDFLINVVSTGKEQEEKVGDSEVL